MAIITKADYKTIKGISGTDYDARLDALIPMAQAMLEKWSGRKFDPATYTDEKYDGPGAASIQLKNYPVKSLTSVEYVDTLGNESTIDATSYTCDPLTGIIKFQPSRNGRLLVTREWDEVVVPDYIGDCPQFIEGHQNIQVTYSAGYDTMPPDLQLAMIQFVDYLMGEVSTSAVGGQEFQKESLGDYSYDRGNKQSSSNSNVMAMFFGPWKAVVV